MDRSRRLAIVIGLLSLLVCASACGEKKDVPSQAASAEGSQLMRGQEIYLQVCAACHGSGLAGAPKLGDKGAWASRKAQGIEKLVESAVRGKGAMPPKGGQAGLSDEKVRAAVMYMVEKGK